MSKFIDDLITAVDAEPTAGQAAATLVNGIAAAIDNTASQANVAEALRVLVRELRRDASSVEQIITAKQK